MMEMFWMVYLAGVGVSASIWLFSVIKGRLRFYQAVTLSFAWPVVVVGLVSLAITLASDMALGYLLGDDDDGEKL